MIKRYIFGHSKDQGDFPLYLFSNKKKIEQYIHYKFKKELMSWLIKSSIGRKVIQSISGLFLILFLLFHMSMNVVLIFSHETYDFLANEILGANWWAIVGTLIVGLGVGVHIIYLSS